MAQDSRRSEASPEAVRRATGKTSEEWFVILDAAGAQSLAHREIALLLRVDHQVAHWWSQHITVEYERARGLREKYQTHRGYQVSVSKTVPVSLAVLYTAFADATRRAVWLPDAPITIRRDTPQKSTRAVWADGDADAPPSHVDINYYESGPNRSRITVQHSRLTDAEDVEERRAYWRAALDRLAETAASQA